MPAGEEGAADDTTMALAMFAPTRNWVTALPVAALPSVMTPEPAAETCASCSLPDSTSVPPEWEFAPLIMTRLPELAALVPPEPPRTVSAPPPLKTPLKAYHQSVAAPVDGISRIVERFSATVPPCPENWEFPYRVTVPEPAAATVMLFATLAALKVRRRLDAPVEACPRVIAAVPAAVVLERVTAPAATVVPPV